LAGALSCAPTLQEQTYSQSCPLVIAFFDWGGCIENKSLIGL
jgi:hypothetical protein